MHCLHSRFQGPSQCLSANRVPIGAARMTGLMNIIAQPHVKRSERLRKNYPEVDVNAEFSNLKMGLIRSGRYFSSPLQDRASFTTLPLPPSCSHDFILKNWQGCADLFWAVVAASNRTDNLIHQHIVNTEWWYYSSYFPKAQPFLSSTQNDWVHH